MGDDADTARVQAKAVAVERARIEAAVLALRGYPDWYELWTPDPRGAYLQAEAVLAAIHAAAPEEPR
jgi:hypothetical protein